MAQDFDHDVATTEAVRARIHRLNDTVQGQHGILIEHSVRLEMQQKQLDHLASTTATREQLTSVASLLEVKFDGLRSDLQPIKNGVYWAVGLVVSGFISAILYVILKHP